MADPELYLLALEEHLWMPIDPLLPLFSPQRRAIILRYRSLADRNRTLWAELLARVLLGQKLALSPLEISIERDSKGKPFCRNGKLHFSLAHSGQWLACSIGSEPNGVDIEQNRTILPCLVKRFFQAEEALYLNNLPETQRNQAVLRFWTLKESYLKYLGTGLAGGLDAVNCLTLLAGTSYLGGKNFTLQDGTEVGIVAPRNHLPQQTKLLHMDADLFQILRITS